MALTVEELQIVLSCDATTAQKVLDQMNATVKAYTEKFQSYFNKLGMDKSPKGIVGNVKAVEKQLDNVTKAIESKGNDWKKAYEKTWGESFSESMSKAFKYDFSSNPNAKWYTPEWLQKQMNSQPNFRYVGPEMGQGGGGIFQKIKSEAAGLGRAIYEDVGPALSRGFSAMGSGISSAVESAKPKVQAFFQELATIAQVSGSKIGAILRGAITIGVKGGIGAIKLIGRTLGGIVAGARRVGGAIKKAFSHTLLGKFLKLLGSVLLRMAAMALIRGTINGIKKGLEELAKTSTSSAKAMNQMKAAGGSIKMALGAAVMPIVKALVPWFYKLAQVVTDAANVIAQFFARVTGQDHYTAVTLSDGLDDVSNSAGDAHKKMKSVLADFDELVVISKQSGGGGGGSTGVDSSFSTVADKLAVSELGDILRQKILEGNWEGVGIALAGKLNAAVNSWNPSEAATNISDKIKNALDLAIGFLETTNWQLLGQKVATFFEEIDWNGIADRLFEGLGAAIGGLGAFLAGLFSDAWQSVKDWFNSYSFDEDGNFIISGFLEGIGDTLKNIGTWIKEHIFDPFITGFKKAFGIASPAEEMKGPGEFVGQGILEGIAAPFKAVGTWLQENIVDPVKNWLEDHFTLDLDLQLPDLTDFGNVWKSLKGGKKTFDAKLTGVKDTVIEKVSSAWNSITGKEETLTTNVDPSDSPTLLNSIKTAWNDLKGGKKNLEAKLSGVKETVMEKISGAWEKITSKDAELTATVPNGLPEVLEPIKTAWESITGGKKNLTLNRDGSASATDLVNIKNPWLAISTKAATLTATLAEETGLSAALNDLKGKWNDISTKTAKFTAELNVENAVKTFVDAWNKLGNKSLELKATLTEKVREAWNKVANAWNNTPLLANQLGKLPTFAQGGVVYGPTMGLMGEYAGAKTNPEVIAPLSTLVDLLSKAGAAPGGSASQEQNDLLREQNRLLRQIAQKEFTISPSVQLGQVISRSQKLYART